VIECLQFEVYTIGPLLCTKDVNFMTGSAQIQRAKCNVKEVALEDESRICAAAWLCRKRRGGAENLFSEV